VDERIREPLLACAPRVSVIVPTYNRAADLRRCLDSLVGQTFKDFEVLVCDDGSTDNTAVVVAPYKDALKLTYHWDENFGGPARPRNTGLRLARGNYVAFLDSDDWWAPRKLAESVRRLDAGADFVYHDLHIARSSRQKIYWRRQRTRALAAPAYDDLLLNGNAICNSSVVLRRDILLAAGGFSEDRALIAWEDYDTWLRVARATDRFVRIDQTLGYYWFGGGNISSPRQLLVNLKRFSELYFDTIADSPKPLPPAWFHYLLGQAKYQVGSYQDAITHMGEALSAGVSINRGARVLIIAALAYARAAIGTWLPFGR
jgi:glycosyltransferase involved in cell wall biosynthesis